jgi:DNA-binding transcriptional LysR family regulator
MVVAIIENALRAEAVEMAVSLNANDRGSLLALVAQGFGAGFIPEHALIPRSDVAYLRLEQPIRLTFAAIWSKLTADRTVRRNFIVCLPLRPSGSTVKFSALLNPLGSYR